MVGRLASGRGSASGGQAQLYVCNTVSNTAEQQSIPSLSCTYIHKYTHTYTHTYMHEMVQMCCVGMMPLGMVLVHFSYPARQNIQIIESLDN